jgi:hypothetical protein
MSILRKNPAGDPQLTCSRAMRQRRIAANIAKLADCSASDLRPNLGGVQRHTIHRPRSDRARAMVRRHSSCGRRNGREAGHRITQRRRIAGSRHDKRLAEKGLHAKARIKLTVSPHNDGTGSCRHGLPAVPDPFSFARQPCQHAKLAAMTTTKRSRLH